MHSFDVLPAYASNIDKILMSNGTCAIAFNSDLDIVYMSDPWSNTISAINTSNNTVITSFAPGKVPCGVGSIQL